MTELRSCGMSRSRRTNWWWLTNWTLCGSTNYRKIILIGLAFLSDSKIKKREHEKFKKYQRQKEELEKMWGVRATVVFGARGAVTHKLGEWLQQIPAIIYEVSVQENAVLWTRFCETSWIIAKRLNFNHILMASFQIHRGCVTASILK